MKAEEYVEEYRRILGLLEKEGIRDPDAAKLILREVAKDRRMEFVSRERQAQAREDEPATEKQKQFLTKLGVSYPPNITKSEAYKAISEAKSRMKKAAAKTGA